MSLVLTIVLGLFALLLAGGMLASMAVNQAMPEGAAIAIMAVLVVLYVLTIVRRIRVRREDPEKDAKEARIMVWIGIVIVALVALAKILSAADRKKNPKW